jgi:formyltetrahydrofolate deformylase
MSRQPRRYILVLRCPDRKGIVAAVAGYLADNDGSIEESHHFHDHEGGTFYMRTVFREDGPAMPGDALLRQGLDVIAARFDMAYQLHDAARRPRVMIAVSRFDHCLVDLLHRWRTGSLTIDIPAVVSNHEDMRSFVEWNGIPFHHLPVTPATRDQQEGDLLHLLETLEIDLLVLARYMQILSPRLCAALAGRCINIHHSFLPSFKGAKPYHQAHARGVKIIGATAHYVTTDLDEGPIIEQGVHRVDHAHTPQACIEAGRAIEAQVLGRAVRWHAEHRVMIAGQKTIVFS